MVFSYPQDVGSFIPTSYIWDVSQLYSVDVNSPEFKELLVRLYQNVNNIAIVLNTKDSGLYERSEFVNGQLYFSDPTLSSQTNVTPVQRQVYRLVVNFGPLPNAATKSVAHGIPITNGYSFTRIYATATDPVAHSYLPIPYASCTDVAHNIELNVDATNVNITTGIDRTAYTIVYAVVEYLKF